MNKREVQNMKNKKITDKEKVNILVEGITDKEILDYSILLLYPTLMQKINIIPFDHPKRNGGIGYISEFLKIIFNANNSGNKYLALFDNDTEGIKIKDILEGYKKDYKLKIVYLSSYPDLDELEKYPTYKTIKKEELLRIILMEELHQLNYICQMIY